jgi:hypothetical protein
MRMQRTQLDSLFTATRILLLATSLCAVGVLCIWVFKPAWIMKLDRKVVSGYKAHYTERLEEVGESPERAEALLEELVDDIDWANKGDRVAQAKVKALEALVTMTSARGELESALDWNEQISELDDNDLVARRQHSRLLSQLPGRRAEGLAGFAELYRTLPGVPWVVAAYSRNLLKMGRAEEALEVAARFDDAEHSKIWRVLIVGGTDKVRGAWLMPRRLPGDVLEVDWQVLPTNHRMMRIQFPPDASMVLEDPEFVVEGQGRVVVVPLDQESVARASGVRFVGSTMVASGAPQAFIEIKMSIVKGIRRFGGTCALRGRVSEYPSMPMTALSVGAPYDALSEQLADDDERLLRLQRTRALMLPLQTWFVLWRPEDGAYNAERKLSGLLGGKLEGSSLRFRSSIEVGQDATSVRINLPGIQGIVFDVERLEAELGGELVDLTTLAVQSHSLQQEGSLMEIDGGDPYIVFELGREVSVGRIFFEGKAR